jgi:xanthine dehydrogenase accessory factor
MAIRVLVLGAGEVATGVIHRLYQTGCQILATELPMPLCVRRTVSFSEAVYMGKQVVEGITATIQHKLMDAEKTIKFGQLPIIVDPDDVVSKQFSYDVLVDARMLKSRQDIDLKRGTLVIGLGPGFLVGKNCHVVVETNRGHYLGRVYWKGSAEQDTGMPEGVSGYRNERVIRAPTTGKYLQVRDIGGLVEKDEIIGEVNGIKVRAPFKGLIRGIVHDGVVIAAGVKIGDLDPRCDKKLLDFISDKALAIGGACLTAICSTPELRGKMES